MDYALIDSHCHIVSDRLFERIDEVIENAKAHHVKRMLVVCVNFEDYEKAKSLYDEDVTFDIALGFHPSDLYEFKEEDYQRLEMILANNEVIALGEIGLDYQWDDVSKEDQKIGFIRQIKLANKYHKPILIHMREATQDTLNILKEYCEVPFLMHCFSGSKETAKEVMRMGGYISFAGPLTFTNARGLNEVPEVCDRDKIMVETDCPYLTPHPYRGKVNEPMYVEVTFKKLCELLQEKEENLAVQIQKNYHAFFNLEM